MATVCLNENAPLTANQGGSSNIDDNRATVVPNNVYYTMNPNDLNPSANFSLDWALYYAGRGLPVFPLHPQSKAPATPNGFYNATTDPNQIRAWWIENPNYNIATPTGNASACIVIDSDGRIGMESIAKLEAKLGPLPKTVTQVTPGKIKDGQHSGTGVHQFYKTKGQSFACQTDIDKCVDIKANGGYIVLAPSVHPDGTGTYKFADGCSFDGVEIAELPPAWRDWILAEQEKKRGKNKAPVDHVLPPASEAVINHCRRRVAKIEPAVQGKGGDKRTFCVACTIFHDYGLTEAEGRPIMHEYNQRCMPPWDEVKLQHKINRALAHSGKKPRGWRRTAYPIEGEYYPPFGAFMLNPSRTQPIALAFRWDLYNHDEGFTLKYYGGEFYRWEGNYYRQAAPESIKGELLDWMTRAATFRNDVVTFKNDKTSPTAHSKESEPIPFSANNRIVNDVLEALKATCLVDNSVKSGTWLGRDDKMPMTSPPIFTQNCVYDWRTGEKHPCSPLWFNLSCAKATMEDIVQVPKRWHQFLYELWGDDQASKDLLHEFMGLCLTLDTSFQKMLLLVGPIRCGKGTIFRMMREILGEENVANPTTDSLIQNFGLQPLLGKPLATIADARFTSKNIQVTIERLLNISGEDAIVVDIKHRTPVSVKLPTRFMIGSNEMPRLPDNAGAIANRFLPLQLKHSFLGREDRGLDAALSKEKAGILALMIEGLRRLYRQGFTQPTYHTLLIQELEELGSPIRTFIRERCELGAGKWCCTNYIWRAWVQWCEDNEQHCGVQSVFGRNLRSCYPEIDKRKVDGSRCYIGIALRTEAIGCINDKK